MLLPFSSMAADQIRYLLETCNPSSFDSVLRQLCEFVEYGSEGNIILLQTCLDQIDFHTGNMQNVLVKPDIVLSVLKYLMQRPNFSTIFCEALRKTWPSNMFLETLSTLLNLSTFEKIGVSLALTDSEIPEFRSRGQNFCIAQIEELCANPSSFPVEQIQDIFVFLSRSEGLVKHVDTFSKILSLLNMKASLPFPLSPMFSDDIYDIDSPRLLDLFIGFQNNDFESILSEIEGEISMADVIGELGYGCTTDSSHCKEMLSLFLPLSEGTISRLLGTIVRTRVGLEDNLNIYSTFSAVLGSTTSTIDSSRLSSWNINVLVDSIKQLAPETNWTSVIENLDYDGFFIPDEESFSFLMSIYSSACQNLFPLHTICGSIWKNSKGQLSFLKHAVCAPPEVFTFGHSERKLMPAEYLHLANGHGNEAWYCLDLFNVLCELAERGHANIVREMLQYPLRHCPEVLLIGIAHSKTSYNFLQCEVFSALFPEILKKNMKGDLLNHLWHANSRLVLYGFIDAYNKDSASILRILELCEELKLLSFVLDSTPFSFSIRLAACASQKELIDLEKWLKENMNLYKDVFYEVCLQFLKENLPNATTNVLSETSERFDSGLSISQDLLQKVVKALQAHLGEIGSPPLSEEMKKIYSSLSSPVKQSGGPVELSASEGSPDAIETEANAYFHQMFSGHLSIEKMVNTLARFKEYPDDKREKRIFDCMIGNLFEEYKFFPKYPDRQLKIAAVLFGSLIKHQLVTHLTLGIALRCVLDALRKSVDSKMFLFGAKALVQFTDRLVEWPQYCNHILQISHLRATHSDLVSFIENALARISSSQTDSSGDIDNNTDHHQSSAPTPVENIESGLPLSSFQIHQRVKSSASSMSHIKQNITPVPNSLVPAHSDVVSSQKATMLPPLQTAQQLPGVSATATLTHGFLRPSHGVANSGIPRQTSHSTGFGAALNIETLVAAAERRDTPIEAPVSEIQDKVHFIINNISVANVDAKAKEFVDILKEQYHPWFAQYMVMKRASIEPNFHDLYLKFLDKINSKTLNREIVKATYENCKVLLRSDLIKSSSEERSLLKNLGSWLGKFTIGRNQALRAREIDPKVLIMEAYEKGLMIAVIPFTSKILEPCQCSLAYQPPNPWTMAILGLLVEIYNLPNLKMNLKFDIEVLFKNLAVDMKDVKPTSLLKDRIREVEGNPDFSNKDINTTQTPIVAESNPGLISTLNRIDLQPLVTNTPHPGGRRNTLAKYAGSLHLAPNTPLDDKMASLSISERIPSCQAQAQATPTASTFSVNQFVASNISSHIVINPKLSALGLQMHLQRIIPMAMETAVTEIISAVVQRSVSISLQTTKELIQKDYALESDENRIRHASKLMVSSLAGSLAHVTCKEPLRLSLSTHLKSLFQALNLSVDLHDQAIQLITNDNLDLGCALVEQSATDKALVNIEGEIGQFISFKRTQRETSGSAYYDAATYAQGPFAHVPEALRPKPGHLSSNQQRVYEEFVKYPWHNQSSHNPNALSVSGQLTSSGGSLGSSLSRNYGSIAGQLNTGGYSMPSAAPAFVGSQSSDLITEEIDPASAQVLSVSSTHSGASDAIVQHASEVNPVVSAYSPSTTELVMMETSSAPKDSGTIVSSSATTATEQIGTSLSELLTTSDALDRYQTLSKKLDSFIAKDPRDSDNTQGFIHGVVTEVHDLLLKCVSRDEAALSIAQKVFKHLCENTSNSIHVHAHLAVLGAIRDVCKPITKELTSWVIFSDEDRKFNKDISLGLIRSELLNVAEYDVHLAKLIDGGRNKSALEFVVSLLHNLLVQESGANIADFYNLMDVLTKISMRPGSSESLQQLVDIARSSTANVISPSGSSFSMEEKTRQFRDKKANFVRSTSSMDDYTISESVGADPVGFRDQISGFFADWFRLCEIPATSDAAYTHFISQLQQNGLLKGDDMTDRFFRVLTELTVAHCLASEQVTQQTQPLSFQTIDIYAKLIFLILKYWSVDHGSNKLALLPKILSVIVRVIQKDSEEKKALFNPRPYFRLFIDLLMDLTTLDSAIEGANLLVLTSFASAFHALQPLKVPGFSFAWLELVSHRSFMPKLLMINNQKGWPFFQRLLVNLFKFMEPRLRGAELGEPVQFLYKGTLRMLLVLLHDFPEFLCDYHFSFCDVIPSSCIQMRNIILSAFPVNMRLPDPCTPNLKIDLLPEIGQSPRILSDVEAALKAKQIKTELDEYLKTKPLGSSFISDLKQKLLLPFSEASLAGTRYNVPLINSLVLYAGMQGIQLLQSSSPPQHISMAQAAYSGSFDIFVVGGAMDIFNKLIPELDTEGRYLVLNAAANQLRYPNNHTHYFSFLLLYLFVEAKQEVIQEQITRVLLERLIVNRPHPWGLLITFIELIKNPKYNFWNKSYIRCAPEIENLFEQVSRSCGGPRVDDGLASGGLSDGVH